MALSLGIQDVFLEFDLTGVLTRQII